MCPWKKTMQQVLPILVDHHFVLFVKEIHHSGCSQGILHGIYPFSFFSLWIVFSRLYSLSEYWLCAGLLLWEWCFSRWCISIPGRSTSAWGRMCTSLWLIIGIRSVSAKSVCALTEISALSSLYVLHSSVLFPSVPFPKISWYPSNVNRWLIWWPWSQVQFNTAPEVQRVPVPYPMKGPTIRKKQKKNKIKL